MSLPSTPSVRSLLFSVYFCLLIAALVYRSRIISGPWFFLLRSFFPNWRFFHRVGAVPVLFVRTSTAEGAWQAWQAMTPRAQRRLSQCWHNPAINLALANQNLVEHLSTDIQALPDGANGADARTLITYQCVQRLARQLLQSSHDTHAIRQYQFQIRIVPAFADADESTATLTSPALTWK